MPVHITITGETAGKALDELRQLSAGMTRDYVTGVTGGVGVEEPVCSTEAPAGVQDAPVPEPKRRGRKAKDAPAEAKHLQPYVLIVPGNNDTQHDTLEDFVDAFAEAARACETPDDLMTFANANNAMAKRLTDEMANDAIQEIGKVLSEMREALAPKAEPAQEEAEPEKEEEAAEEPADMLDDSVAAPTIDDVRAKCADVLNKKGADALRKILTAFKAEKVKFLKPDDYAAVLKACDMALG